MTAGPSLICVTGVREGAGNSSTANEIEWRVRTREREELRLSENDTAFVVGSAL